MCEERGAMKKKIETQKEKLEEPMHEKKLKRFVCFTSGLPFFRLKRNSRYRRKREKGGVGSGGGGEGVSVAQEYLTVVTQIRQI